MKHLPAILPGLLVAILMTAIMGCSDDDNATGSDDIIISEQDSIILTDFLSDNTYDAPLTSVQFSIALFDSIPGAVIAKGNSGIKSLAATDEEIIIKAVSSYAYDTDDGWHIFGFTGELVDLEDLSDTIDISGTDSMKIWNDGQPMQEIMDDSDIDSAYFRVHATWTSRATIDSGMVNHTLDIWRVFDDPDSLVGLRGATDDGLSVEFEEDTIYCTIEADEQITLNDLLFPEDENEDCPVSGSLSRTASLNIGCMTDSEPPNTFDFNDVWTVNVTVNGDGSLTVNFTNGTISWTSTGPCEE